MTKFEEVQQMLMDRYQRQRELQQSEPIDTEKEELYGKIKNDWYANHPNEELTTEYLESQYHEFLMNKKKEDVKK